MAGYRHANSSPTFSIQSDGHRFFRLDVPASHYKIQLSLIGLNPRDGMVL